MELERGNKVQKMQYNKLAVCLFISSNDLSDITTAMGAQASTPGHIWQVLGHLSCCPWGHCRSGRSYTLSLLHWLTLLQACKHPDFTDFLKPFKDSWPVELILKQYYNNYRSNQSVKRKQAAEKEPTPDDEPVDNIWDNAIKSLYGSGVDTSNVKWQALINSQQGNS